MQSMSNIINQFNLHDYKTAIVYAFNIQDETSVAEVTKAACRILNKVCRYRALNRGAIWAGKLLKLCKLLNVFACGAGLKYAGR